MDHTIRACYPVSLLPAGRPCLVVGGGRVAARKVETLKQAGARVRVVALEATEALRQLAEAGAIELELRAVTSQDLEGVFLVIVATDEAALNERLSRECHQRGLLVNVVDQPDLCNFYVPAVVQRGPISVAVSTGGASPALARRLRLLLEATVGEEYGSLAALMSELRGEVMAAYARQSDRAVAWNRLLDSEVLDLLREGQDEEARRRARKILGLPEQA